MRHLILHTHTNSRTFIVYRSHRIRQLVYFYLPSWSWAVFVDENVLQLIEPISHRLCALIWRLKNSAGESAQIWKLIAKNGKLKQTNMHSPQAEMNCRTWIVDWKSLFRAQGIVANVITDFSYVPINACTVECRPRQWSYTWQPANVHKQTER